MNISALSLAGAPPSPPERRAWIAGMPVDVLGEAEIIALLERTVTAGDRIVLANANLHGLYAAFTSPPMLALLNDMRTVVHIDGTPIVWIAKLLGHTIPEKARNTHIDLIPAMLARCAERNWPVAIVGSDAAGAADNERALTGLVPSLRVTAFDGYFDLDDDKPGSKQRRIFDAVAALRPALLLVGMGMPRQETWIARNRDRLNASVIMPVGGFADYFAGRTRTPPRFLGPLGLEWVYRLVHDPRRLGFRYLVEPFLLLGLVALRTLRGARWR